MRTLVLNAGYEPLAVVSYRRALVLLLNNKATMVQGDDARPVLSVSSSWARPSVILLSRHVKTPHLYRVPTSRRGVLRRDEAKCGYCGRHANTIDHIVPRSRGGADNWENLVACCLECNSAKGDHTPAEMGWTLRVTPKAPHGRAWVVRGFERPEPEWTEFLQAA